MPRRIDPNSKRQQMKRLAEAGASVREIADEMGLIPSRIRADLYDMGVRARRERNPPANRHLVVEFARTHTVPEIAARLGYHPNTIYAILKEQNIYPISERGRARRERIRKERQQGHAPDRGC